MSESARLSTRVLLALLGATAVVAAELAALAFSVRLSVAAVDGLVPATFSAVPVGAVSVAAAGVAIIVKQRGVHGAGLTASGVVLIAAAPVTAFGGSCGITSDGMTMFRSGVRVGIAVEQCVVFLNGALLILGYGLLAAGLWLAAEQFACSNLGGLRRRRTAD